MDPMEIENMDDNVTEDPIVTLLQQKLESVRACNQELEKAIERTNAHIAEVNVNSHESSLTIGSIRKKYQHGKWCFIVDVTAFDSSITYSNFDMSFEWYPMICPTYALSIYSKDEKDFVTEAKITLGIQLFIAFDEIEFDEYGKFVADAALFYQTSDETAHSNDNKVRLGVPLPKFEVGVDELIAGAITNLHLTNGDAEATLATLVCSTPIRLAMTLSMSTPLAHYLVIDCMFRELPFDFRHGSKCFLLNANVGHLDGCILKFVDELGVYLVDLYVRDRRHLHNVLHHLHWSIKGITIVPLMCKSQLRKQKESSESEGFSSQEFGTSQRPKGVDADAKRFGECLLRQIDSVIDFQENIVENKEMSLECDVTDEYNSMRNVLTLNEYSSDVFYETFTSG